MAQIRIQENLCEIRNRIARAAERAGRRPGDITLIAVSKTHPASAIRAAYDAGVRHFGENRVQEWEGKREALGDLKDTTWHLIGHLQSNKAARAAKCFHNVDSLDDFTLAQRLHRAVEQSGGTAPLRVLIEVHLAKEEAKSGVAPQGLHALAEQVVTLPRLKLAGLMCIPPFLEVPEQVRPFFRQLRGLRDELSARLGEALPVLSMGMSHDFEVAIEEGATEVRVGAALFGARTAT